MPIVQTPLQILDNNQNIANNRGNQSSVSSNPSAINPVLKTPAAQTYIQNQTQNDNPFSTSNLNSYYNKVLTNPTATANSKLEANNFLFPNSGNQNNANNPQVNNDSTQPQSPQPSAYDAAVTNYTKAYQDYINTLNPSSDVVTAQNTYNDYAANQNKSIAGLAGKDASVPLSIVKGNQAKLLAQTQPEVARLQNQVNIAQGNQTAQSNAGLANVSLQEKLLGLQQSPAQQASSQLATQKAQADLANTQATTARTIADTNSPMTALDLQNKQLQNQKLQQEIANPKGVNGTYTPDQLSNITDTTNSGIPFIGSQTLTDFKTISDSLPNNSNVKVLSPTNTTLVGNIDQSRDNLSTVQDALSGLLATSGGDPKRFLNTVVSKTDIGNNADKLAAFNSLGITGLGVVKTILKIPGARLYGVSTDPTSYIPSVSDTVGEAKQKVDNLNKLLDNTEKSIFGNSYYTKQKDSQNNAGFSAQAGGQTYTFPDQKSLDAFKKEARIK